MSKRVGIDRVDWVGHSVPDRDGGSESYAFSTHILFLAEHFLNII